jgi:hypothetical protein
MGNEIAGSNNENISGGEKESLSPEQLQQSIQNGEKQAEAYHVAHENTEAEHNKEVAGLNDPASEYPPSTESEESSEPVNENSEVTENEPNPEDFEDVILNDPEYASQPPDVKAQIQKLVKEKVAEAEAGKEFGIIITISEIKAEIDASVELKESDSVMDKYDERISFHLESGNSKIETAKLLLQEFSANEEFPESTKKILENVIAVNQFAETSPKVSATEKNIIQSTLEKSDIFSAQGFEVAMHQIYNSADISEETKKELVRQSGVQIPPMDVKTTSDLYKDLENRDDVRQEKIKQLKTQEKELIKRKETLEKKPVSEMTEAELNKLKQINADLSEIKDSTEKLENEQGKETKRAIANGTVEMKGKKAVFEFGDKRIPVDMNPGVLGFNRKRQHADIWTGSLYEHIENGNGARQPLHLGGVLYSEVESGKPITNQQREVTKTILSFTGVGKRGEIPTSQELKEIEMIFKPFRDPEFANGKGLEGARADFRELGLLKPGEYNLTPQGAKKMGEMIKYIRTNPGTDFNALKERFGKKESKQ